MGIRGTFTDPGIDWAELIGSVPFRQHVGSGMDPCAFIGVAPLGGQVEPPSSYKTFWVVVSNIFYIHSYLGKITILTHIYRMGWFNHQLARL